MNKKKIFGYLFMGLLAAGATGTVTSCKDYDDDINNNKSAIQTLQSDLATAKANLESEISSLKTQLETANGKLTTLTSQVAANTADITKAQSDIAALQSRLATAESTLQSINATLALKADQKALEDSCASIYGKLESVTDGLGKAIEAEADARQAADADLQQQITALNNLIGQNSDAKTTYEKLLADVKALQEKTKDLDVAALKSELQTLSSEIDAINANINVLNVLLEKSLRSLVFIPQSYYWGIEATKLLYLDFDYVNDNAWISAMDWDKKEAKGYDNDARYTTAEGTKVLSFAATYHMNPSSAKLDENTTKVSVESGDLDYVLTKSAAAGISVKSWAAENGILTVNLDVNDPKQIKSVVKNQMVTNFATKVNVATKNDKDTTITSDYATLYTEEVSGLKLALTNNNVNGHLFADAAKSALSACEQETSTSYGHLMQTVNEASNTFDAQVFCNWDQTLDLSKFVETHYKNVEGKFAKIDDATFNANFEYKFSLTALYKGNNATDESAHAAIAEDGVTFRPQAPTADGKQAAYGSEQVRAQEVGRTPVVRVELVDKETGKVYDYGYIRIKIVDEKESPISSDKSVSYTGADYSYNGECTPNSWSYATKWYITEQDLYKELGLTREEFEKNYTLVGDVDDLTQFQADKNGKFQELATKIGTASSVTDKDTDPDGTKSSILKWEMTSAQAYKFFVTDKKGGESIAIKYKSADKTVGPDVYVVFKTGSLTGTQPSASLNLDPAKNSTIWSEKNGVAGSGKYEFDMNVNSPNDYNIVANGDKPFEKTLAEAFTGNKIDAAAIITNLVDETASKEYAASKLTLDLQFDQANVGKEFKGISGKTYVLSVSADGKTLQANVKGQTAKQAIVKIEGENVNAQKAVYQQTEYAKDLLNYKKHNELDDETLTAIVGILAKNACHELPLTDNTFNVRFLRPLNITNTTAEVEDAGDAAQVIDLMKLLSFSDWRDLWQNGYDKFYGIKGVKVVGVADGQKISTNSDVLTDQNGNTETMVPLQNVNGAIDFVYNDGKLTYKNYNSTTADFKVQIPVVVTYDWGEVPQTITVTVKRTHSNAKK
jgi:peptidoglycan hydrolase CwlO-like protein